MESIELLKIAIGALVSVVGGLSSALVVLWKQNNKSTKIIVDLAMQGGNSNELLEKILCLVEMLSPAAGRKKSSHHARA